MHEHILPFRRSDAEPLPSAPRSRDLTVSEVVAARLEDLRVRVRAGSYSAQAFEDVSRELNRFAEVFGRQRISECAQYDLTRWLALNPQWESNHTKRRVLATIIACFRWAADEELTDHCPYRRSKKLKLPVRPRRPAEWSEYVRLMRGGSRELRRMLFFLRRSGARTCEPRDLIWPWVHFEAAGIVLDDHKTDAVTEEPRFIPLEPALLRFLRNLHRRRQRARERGEQHVFLNCRGTPWDRHTFARHLRRTAARLGLDECIGERVSGYCLRHTFTVDCLEAGMGERQVADLLGHKTTRLVSWYGAQTRRRLPHLRRFAGEAIRLRRRGGNDPQSNPNEAR